MRTTILLATVIAALLSYPAHAGEPEAPGAPEQVQTTEGWTAPASAARKTNPIAADATSLAVGLKLYEEHCAACHGVKGHADGPAAQDLDPQPRDFAAPMIAQHSDGELFWKITEGNAPMPGYGDLLTSEQRWHVVNYVRSLTNTSPSESAGSGTPAAAPETATQEVIDDLQEQLDKLRRQFVDVRPGTTDFVITGYGFSNYTDADGENSNFTAGFNPIFLWKLNDRTFFEGEIEMELEGSETETVLEYANLVYFLNRYLTITGGQFLTPLGTFQERLHPAWINKLPDAPVAFGHDGLVPTSSLGLQLRGGAAAGRTKVNYALYVSNGPRLNTGEEEPEEAGMLLFDNFEDNNDDKAIGGRFGFLPIPQLEVGYGFLGGKVGDSGSEQEDVGALIQAIDLSYFRSSNLLRGSIDVRGEWIWSKVDDAHDIEFENERDGGYLQLAYRPTAPSSRILKNLEPVIRYDTLDLPAGAPENIDQKRWTWGLNYWFGPSTVMKLAYQRADLRGGNESGDGEEPASGIRNAVLFQIAIGF